MSHELRHLGLSALFAYIRSFSSAVSRRRLERKALSLNVAKYSLHRDTRNVVTLSACIPLQTAHGWLIEPNGSIKRIRSTRNIGLYVSHRPVVPTPWASRHHLPVGGVDGIRGPQVVFLGSSVPRSPLRINVPSRHLRTETPSLSACFNHQELPGTLESLIKIPSEGPKVRSFRRRQVETNV